MKKVLSFLTMLLFIVFAGYAQVEVPVFVEDFEGGTLDGWTTIDSDGDGYNWGNSSSILEAGSGHDGSNYCAFSQSYDNNHGALEPDNWLISPAITLGDGSSTLSFWVCGQDASWCQEHYAVYVSTTTPDINAFGDPVFEETIPAVSARDQSPWRQISVDLSDYAGQTIYIAFRHYDISDMYFLDLDDIEVTSVISNPILVVSPIEVNFSSVLVGETATRTVTVGGYNLTDMITVTITSPFEISSDGETFDYSATLPSTGGTLTVRYAPTMGGTDEGTITISSANVSDAIIPITGSGVDCSNIILPFTENFEVNSPSYNCWTKISMNEENSFGFGTLDGNRCFAFSSIEDADDYYQYLISPELPVTDNAKIFTFDYRVYDYYGYYIEETFRVGYSTTTNDISDFQWGPEITATNSSNWENYENISIPGDAKYIAINYTSEYAYYLFVDNAKVEEMADCMSPNNIVVSNIGANSAVVGWTSRSEEEAWSVVVVEHGENPDEAVSEYEYVESNPYTVTDLAPTTQYDVYVAAECESGMSVWSTVATFTTTPDCSNPSNLVFNDIFGTSATVQWTAAPYGVSDYVLEYGLVEDDSWTTINVEGATSYVLSGLEPQTSYGVRVTSVCNSETIEPEPISGSFFTSCLVSTDMAIGTGTSTSYQLPLNSYYKYTYTQELYLASELGGQSMDINGISFEYAYSTPISKKNNVNIYLGHTSLSSFGESDPMVAFDNLQLVYSGNLNCSNGWNHFAFDTVFTYNGTDNLVLAIDDNSGQYHSQSHVFNTFTSGDNMSITYYQDESDINPQTPSASSVAHLPERNVVKFSYCQEGSCVAPVVTDITSTTEDITITWAPGYQETAWDLEYKLASDTEWTSVNAPTSPYTMSNLTAGNNYDVRLYANCGNGELSDPISITVATQCAMISELPFSENFEYVPSTTSSDPASNNLPNCWNYYNNGESLAFYPYVYTEDGTNNKIHFYTTNDDWYTIAGDQYAILPQIDVEANPINTLILSFDAVQEDYVDYFKVKVGVMTDPSNPNTFVPVQTITAGEISANYEVSFASYTGSGSYIAIMAEVEDYEYNGGYIDNIVLDVIPECARPSSLSVSGTTESSISLAWEVADEEQYEWTVEYGVQGFTPGEGETVPAYDPFITFEDLTDTVYDFYVYANCASGMSDYRGPVSARPGDFVMPATGTDTLHTCFVNLYDNGGPDGNYTNNCNYTVVIYPDENMVSKITGVCDLETNYDIVYIYEGVGTEESSLLYSSKVDGPNVNVVSTLGPLTVKFTSDISNTESGFELNVRCEEAPSCIRPMGLTATEATINSVTLSWTENGSATNWNVMYGPAGFTPGSENATIVNVTENPTTITGLTPSTYYDFYVQAVCDLNDTSEYSNVFNTSTACGMIAIPYTQNFDGQGTGFDAYPLCWSRYSTYNVNSYPTITSLYTASGNASMSMYANTRAQYNLAVLPQIDVDNYPINTLQLSFQMRSPNGGEMIIVGAMTDPDDATTFTPIDTVTNSVSNSFELKEIFLSNYEGDGTYVALKGTNSSYTTIYIDDVILDLIPNCIKPSGLTATAVTDNAVTLSWTPGGDEQSWEVVYGAPGFVPDPADAEPATTNTFTATGLTDATSYDFYVRAVCSVGETSAWSQKLTVTTLCLPETYPFSEDFEDGALSSCWGQNIISGNVNWQVVTPTENPSNAHSGTKAVRYKATTRGFETDLMTPVIDMSQAVSPMLSFWFTNKDWSGDQDVLTVFYRSSSADEWTQLAIYDNNVSSWTKDSIMLPNPSATYQICFRGHSEYGYGIYLDDIVIDEGNGDTPIVETCDAPTQVAASNIAQTTAIITWTAGGDETAWNLQYKAASATEWSENIAVNNEPSYELSGLTANTQYNVRVQAVCSEDATSQWANGSFTTLAEDIPTCPSPTNVTVTDIQNHSAVIDWEQADNTVTSWDVNYKKSSSAVWTSVTTESKPYTLTNLEGLTEYDVQVLAHCEGDLVSDPSEVQHFTTTNVGVNEYDMDGVVSVYPNPTNGQFTIDNAQCTISSVDVYDVYGKLIGTTKVEDTHATLDIRGYADGVYFLRVVTENGVVTKRIVKK